MQKPQQRLAGSVTAAAMMAMLMLRLNIEQDTQQ